MSRPVKVFVVGEGKNELGGRIGPPSYHDHEKRGVIEALLLKVRAHGWEIGGCCEWKRIRKFKAKGHIDSETRNVLGAALDAKEANCPVLAFCRDRDNDEGRCAAIEAGIRVAVETIYSPPDIIGGVVIPTMEGWILALLARRKTDSLSPVRAAKDLQDLGIAEKDTAAMVKVVDDANLDAVPNDAMSLHQWLNRAREVMARHVP